MEIAPLVAVAVSAAVWLWFIRRHDKFKPEPLKALLRAFLLGGVASAVPASILNDVVIALNEVNPLRNPENLGSMVMFSLWVGFNEEFWKALATVGLMRNHPQFDEPVDGIIYAMTVALGFAALENLVYVYQHGLGVIFVRSLISIPAHLTCAAVWGYGLARIKFLSPRPRYFREMARYVAAAGLAHALYDLSLFMGYRTIPAGLALLVGLILYTRWRLKQLLRHSPAAPPGICPSCRYINPLGERFCRSCGTDLGEEFCRICPWCGRRLPMSETRCYVCGHTQPPPLK